MFIPWATDFRKLLLDRYPLSEGEYPIPDDVQLPPKWILQESGTVTGDTAAVADSFPGLHHLDHDVRPLPDTFTATLVQNKRVTPIKHWQDVRHICLTTPEALSYEPGDIVCITPKNFADDVQALINLMCWNEQADKPVCLVPGKGSDTANSILHSPPIPELASYPRLTLRALLTDYLDIKSIPRRSFFSAISHYTNDTMQKERLLEFVNPEYIDEFWDYTTRPRRSILEVLEEFHTVKIPWEHVPSLFPVIRARQFSIASGGELTRTATGETNFELLIAIVKYQTVIKRIRQGVCTRYLSSLQPGSTLRVQLQRGGLNPSVSQIAGPTVLVGPGTGIAPLRSVLWQKAALVTAYRHRQRQQQQGNPDATQQLQIAPTILLFGGRNRTADFFFEDEWTQLAPLVNLVVFTAFSRDQRGKVYVQDRIRENFAPLFQMLYDLHGSVILCGSSGRMPQAVREALIECFQYGAETEEEGLSRQEAEEYLMEMERDGRYKQETW